MPKTNSNREPRVGDEIVFYGSLMRGLGGTEALPSRDALRYLGPCRIEGELYDLGPYPALCPTKTVGARSTVRAERYALLDVRVIEELDHFEGYEPEYPEDSLYLRKRVPIFDASDLSLTPKNAWVYLYNRTLDDSPRVDSGDWRAHLLKRAEADRPAK